MKLLIATPAYNMQVTTPYFDSVMNLMFHLHAQMPQMSFDHRFLTDSVVSVSRNIFASLVLEKDYTHLLFVDADMGFAPSLVHKMIVHDKPLIGGLCPQRRADDAALHRLAGQGVALDQARLIAQPYCLAGGAYRTPDGQGGSQLEVVQGAMRVHAIGCGVTLVRREVFEKIKAADPALWTAQVPEYFRQFGLTKGLLQCFDHMKREDGVTMAEDISFCARWTNLCGGEIWAIVDERISHVGPAVFQGRYLDRLAHEHSGTGQ